MQLADLPPDDPGPAPSELPRDRRYAWDDPAPSAAAAKDLDGLTFLQAILDGKNGLIPLLNHTCRPAGGTDPGLHACARPGAVSA